MGYVKLNNEDVELGGGFIKQGNLAMNFVLRNQNLETITLDFFKGKIKVIATVPSIDTPVCSQESIALSRLAIAYPDVAFLVVSKDLPFAQKRFCSHEKIHNLHFLSDILPESNFGKDFGVRIESGPLKGLLTRSIYVCDKADRVTYSELVEEITQQPDFESLEKSLKNLQAEN